MIYLFILSLVSVLCATEAEPTFYQDSSLEVTQKIVRPASTLSPSSSDFRAKAPVTMNGDPNLVRVLGYASLTSLMLVVWAAAIIYRS